MLDVDPIETKSIGFPALITVAQKIPSGLMHHPFHARFGS